MADVWLISGIPGSGKTTVGRLLAQRFARAAFIEGDRLQEWIVAGNVWPGTEPAEEALRQIDLNTRNQCLLARSYAEAGFTAIVDYPIVSRESLQAYLAALAGLAVHLVVLHPGTPVAIARDAEREKSRRHRVRHGMTIGEHYAHLAQPLVDQLAGIGLWLDDAQLTPEESVEAILAGRQRARVAATA